MSAKKFQKRVGIRECQFKHRHDFSKVKWEKSDIEIAMQLGCSNATVRKYRKQFGKPKVKDRHTGTPFQKSGFKTPKPGYVDAFAPDQEEPVNFSEYGVES